VILITGGEGGLASLADREAGSTALRAIGSNDGCRDLGGFKKPWFPGHGAADALVIDSGWDGMAGRTGPRQPKSRGNLMRNNQK
jgi:hypothetical protein